MTMTTHPPPLAVALGSIFPPFGPPTGGPDRSPAGAHSLLVLPSDVRDSTKERVRDVADRNPERPPDTTATMTRLHRLVEELRGLGVELRAEPKDIAPTPPLVPGSAEFDRRNRRRFELIDKRVDHGLTTEEEAEFQQLQSEILRVTRARFPLPPLPQLVRPNAKGGPPD